MGLCAAIGLLNSCIQTANAEEMGGMDKGKTHDKQDGKMTMPDTAQGVWVEIHKHSGELADVVKARKLDEVHHHAFAIRDLVNTLPDKSKELSADKLAKLKANTKFVASLAGRLDKSGDANDQAGTESNLMKLQGVIKVIESFYPTSVTGGGMEHKEEMEGMKGM